jgi:2-polyprenyl-3-methyl-5-hydroxy-6-metoxy-1,4-benzoquinol methylase
MHTQQAVANSNDVEFASQFPEYRETNVRKPVEHYTIHNCMLKLLLDDHGLLTGKRILDLACGHGYYTRQLKALNCGLSSGLIRVQ